MVAKVNDYHFRYDLADVGEFELEELNGRFPLVKIRANRFRVTKVTPRGVWLSVYGEPKFVLNDSKKRWAYPTQLEALNAFLLRKARHISILTYQLRVAEGARAAAERELAAGVPEA